jgi:5-methylcytosine-specific restriction enzyme subunit McrC
MYCDKNKQITAYEHYNEDLNLSEFFFKDQEIYKTTFPKKRKDGFIFEIFRNKKTGKPILNTGYYIGVDHVYGTDTTIYIAPKLNSRIPEIKEIKERENENNRDLIQVDYLKMLLDSLQNPELFEDFEELFIIKWDEPEIKLNHQKDLLTPFLVLQFLGLMKSIVRKGLKKSYYKLERNLKSRVKGKILIGKTLKQNHFKNKHLSNVCTYDEFGVNGIENRFLKKTLEFVKPYMEAHSTIIEGSNLLDLYNFINPGFSRVSSDYKHHELKAIKENSFYKEYNQAMDLAQKIRKRLGNNISENSAEHKLTTTPPFWIDMSKLFEVYVLGLLRTEYGGNVHFQIKASSNELDYIIKTDKGAIIADAKYKAWYKHNREDFMTKDLRQVSGYARLKKIREMFNIKENEVPKCLIIYPTLSGGQETISRNDLLKDEMQSYFNIYKIGLNIPTIKN